MDHYSFLGSKKWTEYPFLGSKKWTEYPFLGSKKWTEYSFLGSNYYEKYSVFCIFRSLSLFKNKIPFTVLVIEPCLKTYEFLPRHENIPLRI